MPSPKPERQNYIMKKKILSLICVLSVLFGSLAIPVFAEDGTTSQTDDNTIASGDTTDESSSETKSTATGEGGNGELAPIDADSPSVQQIVYDFLTKDLSLCPAAAAGIMGNVMIECLFDPSKKAMDTNNKLSFGLMMWNGPRYESLKTWCAEHGYDKNDPLGQLGYLKWELENTETQAYKAMLNVPNTIEGTVEAAILWASKFERCTKTSYGLRIYYAVNNYWRQYAGGTVSNTPGVYGYYYNVPDNIQHGKPLTLYGGVVSYSSPLKSINASVYTEDGTHVTGRSVMNSDLAGNIGNNDYYVVFNKLAKGNYYYVITATNQTGEYVIERHPFTVTDEPNSYSLVTESEGGVICKLGAKCPQLNFSDMRPANYWAHDSIDFVLQHGYFKGMGGGLLSPELNMTRAMAVTLLDRVAADYPLPNTNASAESTDEIRFTDVPEDEWYTPSVKWAVKNGIVDGKSEEIFAPEDNITRGELAALMARFASKYFPEGTATEAEGAVPDFSAFTDGHLVPAWLQKDMAWAVKNGLVNGSSNPDGTLSLNFEDFATREEVATIIMRFIDLLDKNNP